MESDRVSVSYSKQSIKEQIADPDQLYVNITIGNPQGPDFTWPYNIKIPQHLPVEGILDIEEAFVYINDPLISHPTFIYLLIKEATQYCNSNAQTTQIVCVFKPVQEFKNSNAAQKGTLYEMPHGFKKKYVQLDSKNSFNFILAKYDFTTNEYIKLNGMFECNLTFIIN